METIVQRLICLVIGYAFGLFQTGYIYGKLHGIDIRKEGSGNAGTTNALRVLGKKAGIITYIGDMVKAVLAAGCKADIRSEPCRHHYGSCPLQRFWSYTWT